MRFFKKFLLLLSAVFLVWLSGYGIFVLSVLSWNVDHPPRTANAIIVLTGGDKRIHTGLDLFAAKRAPKLFITGVNNGVVLDTLIQSWPGLPGGKHSLPACCMELGHKAGTTVGNAHEAHEWIQKNKIASILLVTSPYHMSRALLEFGALMPGLEISPHPVMQSVLTPEDRFFWNITFMEYHKILYRALALTFTTEEAL